MADALTLRDVRAGYGETVVIEEIGFTLPERGSLSVLGRNGVGKTTLLATIMGHTTFHAGAIAYQGKPIEKLPVYERNRLGVGFVPQARDIFPSLSVEENLTVAARPGRWTLSRVYDLFPRLADRRRHWGNQISGGEQQMLAIGRALMGNPSLLLMDEPLEGLAPIIVELLLAALQRLIRGRIAYSGPSADLLADPQRLTSLVVA
jgi:branched-chain amino acid transport system ATP-binding protein